ncbi:PREDICTED: uncharacterized protein LOC105557398 isoform X2 [Vollenhovia emeryi]|uniref:uncharacterized protein LOC105557398 isoform X2 n=1 Tax=Vollenhovia emeryi TaxID=411798 RepID=UPI0005F42C1E|nr:PREDICTED: uncharacterized protein LOC105557398 isoform X2 [Vollenhovia emeryi]
MLTSSLALRDVIIRAKCAQDFESSKVDQILVSLQDADTGVIYKTHLSTKDAQRVRTDIVFASKILEKLKDDKTESDPLNVETSDAENSAPDSFFKWSHQAVLLLIEEYRKREKDTTSGKISQKRLWESISNVLCSHGHDVTGPQCQSKFNGMKRTFKSIKDHNSKSGNNPRSWLYTEVMESLLGEKPFMNPVALASSTGHLQTESETSDVSSLDDCDNSHTSCSRKRKSSNIAEAILESRKIAEENKLKRHRQTMEQRDKVLNALDKLIGVLQPR